MEDGLQTSPAMFSVAVLEDTQIRSFEFQRLSDFMAFDDELAVFDTVPVGVSNRVNDLAA